MVTLPIQALHGNYAGKTCSIVGKGPSLQHLRARDLADGPVIALNHSILFVAMHRHDHVFSMQKDGGTGVVDVVRPPDDVPLIISRAESHELFADHPLRFEVDVERDMGITWDTPSVFVACRIARDVFRASEIAFVACDCLIGEPRGIWFTPDGVPYVDAASVFGHHPPLISELLGDFPWRVVTPCA